MQLPAGDIEVVVLGGDDEPEVARPPRRPRPWSAAVVALVALLAVLGLPVADPEPVDPGPTTASTSVPDRRRGGCPPPEVVRLWCSFVADSPCCPGGAPAAGGWASGIRLASSTGVTTSGGLPTGGKVTGDVASGCSDLGGESAAPAQRAVTRRA